ncbi:calciumbinding atopy-related autoantigen [Plasmopara halstedii]|uniref:Calciumbinding atopy-related autoantigen n=1 Tax=Plasmopara halstedii TaxID=4781 RepID=A0A0P1AS55_PLAHL|nr:calciumbinding atopy-related autoantigen [Plasmopara halstedii]CEG44456.1 calciumbinding atopy-related autoantigen [Plasmopara halstedii]|eukprot:XP_024580825.1 calciumbinding atopy-related autoantigen [Plasmopara halstedii]
MATSLSTVSPINFASPRKVINHLEGARTSGCFYTQPSERQSNVALGMAAVALAALAFPRNCVSETLSEATQVVEGKKSVSTKTQLESTRVGVGRRSLLKQRSKYQAKLEEVDQLKMHLDEYKQSRESMYSLFQRFDMYASENVESGDGKRVKVMTFTDFLHSIVLPQFHLRSPRLDLSYTCDFVGNANGLITYEEYYLLIHLLQIPKEHFEVAFCMFDLDSDGMVDKAEFCSVIENLLRSINDHEAREKNIASAESSLPRLTKFLFGRFKKTISAKDLEAALNLLRTKILRFEYDMYATVDQLTKQQSMSVHDFALTLISCFDPEKLPPYLERVQALTESDGAVTWDDFFTFHFNVQSNLTDIKAALELIGVDEIKEADFTRAVRVASGTELSSPVVRLAFRIFDENASGTLNQSELLKVLEMRNKVQLKQDSKLESRLKKFWHCVRVIEKK